ncbi:MAG: hypothetical protein HZB84_02880 [Deltaproteobacteria bacterium]|nr:hypothetical protein [Deltaproteobacteria bacterium]
MREKAGDVRSFLDSRWMPLAVIAAALLLLTGRYLLYGVPHEYLTGEYKGTFEGDYDFTLELVRSAREWGRLPLWSATYSGPIAVFASNFHVFEQALLYPLTRNLALSIKILQAAQLLVAGLGMYCLSRYLWKDRAAAAFSALLYMFTPFYIGHLLSYLHYTGVYLLAPFVYLLILKAVRERSLYHAFFLSLVAAYSLLAHPQNVFIGGIFYGLFFALVFAHGAFESAREGDLRVFLKKIVSMAALTATVVFLLSAFITIPTLIDNYPYLRTSWVKGAGALVKVDTGHIGSHSESFLASVTLQHWPWLEAPLKGGEYPPWGYMAVYMMPFVLASLSLLLEFNWVTFVFVFMTLLSVQIARGIHGQPDLFSLASKYIPFFGMSRTPYAYINSSILVFCLLSSVSFAWLSARFSDALFRAGKTMGGTGARWLLLLALIAPYLVAARYYGNYYNWTFISAREPEYLSKVWKWMDANNGSGGRVIETCGIPTAMILGQRMLPNQVDLLERYHRKEYLGRYLALFGFRYVITPSLHSQRHRTFDKKGYMVPSVFDRGESMEEYYSALTTEYYHIYQRLKDDPGFTLHTAGTRDVAIFENRSAFPDYEIYQARPVMVLGGTEGYDLMSLDRYSEKGLRVAPVFIAQSGNLKMLNEIKGASGDLVLHDTDGLDMFMLLGKQGLITFQPAPKDPHNWSLAINSYGIQQPFPQQDHSIGNSLDGEMTFADYAVTSRTRGSSLEGRFTIKDTGPYRVLLRAYGGKENANLSWSIDGRIKGTADNSARPGFAWVGLWEGELRAGAHRIEIIVADDKPVSIDSIAIGNPELIDMGAATSLAGFSEDSITYIINYRKFLLNGKMASTRFTSGSGGAYTPAIRLGRFRPIDGNGAVRVFLDGKRAGEIPYSELTGTAREYRLREILLSPGEHTVRLEGLENGLYFDLFALEGRAGAPMAGGGLRYEKTGPSSYLFEVPADGPRFVVFNETNYPGWKMDIDGVKSTPVITNMFMNGFILPDGAPAPGATARVYYANRAQIFGVAVSIATFFTVVVSIVVLGRRKKG